MRKTKLDPNFHIYYKDKHYTAWENTSIFYFIILLKEVIVSIYFSILYYIKML